MNKVNLNYRNITIIASYLFLTAVFFIAGFFIGKLNTNPSPTLEASSSVNTEPYAAATPYESASPITHRVILEDGEIRLYADENGTSRLISAEKIFEDAYPVSDIASLKKGIIFHDLDSAVSLMENFIS